MAKLTFLGTGTSQGVPMIGCDCDVCRSSDPRDKRLRSSVLVEHEGLTILVDAGPDFRQQMLRAEVSHLDAILLTHNHKDHTGGLDDIRAKCEQAVKNLPTGDSGMICFADEELDKECRMVSWMGINKDTYARTSNQGTYKWNYGVDYVGFKYNGNAIMAALALAQLPYLDEENARRREICKIYDKAFEGNPNIRIIRAPYPEECSFHIYEIVVPDREALLSELAKNDIYGGVHYRDNTEFSMYTYAQGTCPVAHEVTQHIITMPLHMYLTNEDVQRIADIVNNFVK